MAKKYAILDVVKGEYIKLDFYDKWQFNNISQAEMVIEYITKMCPALISEFEVVEIEVKIGE